MLCCFLVYLGMLVLLESTSFHLESLPSGPMIFKYVFLFIKSATSVSRCMYPGIPLFQVPLS